MKAARADRQPAPIAPASVFPPIGRRKRRSAPPMRVSLFEPAGRRTQWWFTGRCLRCGGTSFGRVRLEEDAEGVRRVSCGHKATIIVARVYRLPSQEAA